MPIKQKKYPNKGIWLDPRAITSAKMPESLCIYKGNLFYAFKYLLKKGYIDYFDIDGHKELITKLVPFKISHNKYLSSLTFQSDKYFIEFFRTSDYNFKVYTLKIAYE